MAKSSKGQTIERPRAATMDAVAGRAPKHAANPTDPIVTAYAIVKVSQGENLWSLFTYTIQGEIVLKVDKSVEDLREILVAKMPDLIGGLL